MFDNLKMESNETFFTATMNTIDQLTLTAEEQQQQMRYVFLLHRISRCRHTATNKNKMLDFNVTV